ncbi:hypothetical protein [Streptomyces luteireticuli]|uniref:hypothetical protein n=1 Tax=Streptomyces luteireticuli TaxID=173858 RepID=UPI0035583279
MDAKDDGWGECVRIADVVIGRERGLADGRYFRERSARYGTWGIPPVTGDALVRILIVLAVRQQQPHGGRALLVEAERALGSCQTYELFAGVPADVGGADRVRIDALRLLSYSGSPVTLERLVGEARQVLRRVVVEL